ncbi:MAG: endo-1,4-beta-xylanase [Chitinophagaceae bacterium]|nr:endo-1,4-beta-xylanase [Chitinophagaceae bacterium]
MKCNWQLGLSIVVVLFTACSKSGGPVTPPVVTPDTILYKMLFFPMGASLNVSLMKNNIKYNGVVTKEYNSITAENAMKFDALHPAENTFSWNDADYLVSFAQANNKRVHGHTLNWYMALPSWVTNFVGDSTAWENLLKTHIQTVVTYFKGKVKSWDVVNEAFNDDGTLRNSIWVQKLGTDYIARCFQYANQADPDAILFYNDYGHEYSAAKRTAIINMITGFKNRGIPIHGIGMQFHITYTQSDANISAAINSAAATGLKVHISELDIRLNTNLALGLSLTPALAEQQAARYTFIVKTYKAIPTAQQFGITTWNVGDGDSWIPNWQGAPDWPLPFDANYLRKPAYRGIIEGGK